MKDNKHIESFLKDDYIDELEALEYAVLLKGKWGSGKTFFINQLIDNYHDNNVKFIKVSLFGLENITEINNKILFNLLSIEQEGLLNEVTKIGMKVIDSLGKKINLSIQDIPIEQIINKSNKKIIFILDDLERSNIDLLKILGYINYFIEQLNFKVIILANEEKLIVDNKYIEFKEKVVGKEFEIISNIEDAYDSFIDNIENKKVLKKYKELIKQLYNKSKYNNLRFLKQSILDFNKLYNKVLEEHEDNKDLIRDFIKIYFIYSIENKRNQFNIKDIKKNYNRYIDSFLVDMNKKEDSKYMNIIDKYNIDSTLGFEMVLTADIWVDILNKSIIDSEKINTIIKSSKYYFDENTPNWKKLLNFQNLSDNEFEKLLDKVTKELKDKEYKVIQEVIHVYSMFMHMNNIGVYSETKDNIKLWSKKNLDSIFSNENIDENYFNTQQKLTGHDAYDGYMYFNNKSELFQEFMTYIVQKLEEWKDEKLVTYAKEILDSIGTKDENILISFSENYGKESKYYDQPILAFMDVDEFYNKISKSPNNSIRDIGYIFRNRYNQSTLNKKLLKELDFLTNLEKKLKSTIKKRTRKLSEYTLDEYLYKPLLEAIKKLKRYKKG